MVGIWKILADAEEREGDLRTKRHEEKKKNPAPPGPDTELFNLIVSWKISSNPAEKAGVLDSIVRLANSLSMPSSEITHIYDMGHQVKDFRKRKLEALLKLVEIPIKNNQVRKLTESEKQEVLYAFDTRYQPEAKYAKVQAPPERRKELGQWKFEWGLRQGERERIASLIQEWQRNDQATDVEPSQQVALAGILLAQILGYIEQVEIPEPRIYQGTPDPDYDSKQRQKILFDCCTEAHLSDYQVGILRSNLEVFIKESKKKQEQQQQKPPIE